MAQQGLVFRVYLCDNMTNICSLQKDEIRVKFVLGDEKR